MKQQKILVFLLLIMLTPCMLWAQDTSHEETSSTTTTSISNDAEATPLVSPVSMLPDISVIGDVKGKLTNQDDDADKHLQLDEVEVVIGGNVYPGIRGDLVLAFHGPDFSAEVEEGYVTIQQFTPQAPIGGRLGIVRLPFGKANPLHPHQLPTVDVPNVVNNLLGGEFIGNGFELTGLIPTTGNLFLNLQLGRWAPRAHHHHDEEGEEHHHEAGAGFTDTMTMGRIWMGTSLGTDREFELGFSGAIGNGTHQHYDEDGNPTHAHATDISLYGIDATYRQWLSGGRRFLAQAEFIQRQEESHGTHRQNGWYALAAFRPNAIQEFGIRYDRSKSPAEESANESYLSAFATRYLNETTYVRLQLKHGQNLHNETVNDATLQFVFGFGPHAHALQ